MKKLMLLALTALTSLSAFGAAGDVIFKQINPSGTAITDRVLANPSAIRVYGLNSSAGTWRPTQFALGTVFSVSGAFGSQTLDLDTDLTVIAGLTPSNNDVLQRKSGAWTNRTLSQYWTDLMADPGTGSYSYTALPFTINTDKRLLGRDNAIPPGVAQEISIGTGLTLSSSTISLDSTAAVTSITGTANQVSASSSTGAVTLSLPQSIAITSTPRFDRLGLGVAASALYRLNILREATTETVNVSGTITAPVATQLFGHAYLDATKFTSTVAADAYSSYDALSEIQGTLNYNHVYGFQARQVYSGSGILDIWSGFTSYPTINAGGSTSIVSGLLVYDAIGAGTIGIQAGLYVNNLTRGSTNYGVYIGGTTPSYFGGAIAANTTITAVGAITGSNLSGTNTGDQTTISGNAGSATVLQTTRTIGGSNFNGSANVTSFPSPGAIGGTTPSTAAFTTISATGQTKGTYSIFSGNILAYDASAGAIYFGYDSGSSIIRSVADNSGTSAPISIQVGNGTQVATITSTGINSAAIGATTPSTVASTTLQATTSVLQGGGLKHQRVTTGSVSAGSTALVTLTWSSAFSDANYTAVASVVDSTTSSLSLSVVHIESISASAVTVRILNNAVGSLTGTLHVIAMRD